MKITEADGLDQFTKDWMSTLFANRVPSPGFTLYWVTERTLRNNMAEADRIEILEFKPLVTIEYIAACAYSNWAGGQFFLKMNEGTQ